MGIVSVASIHINRTEECCDRTITTLPNWETSMQHSHIHSFIHSLYKLTHSHVQLQTNNHFKTYYRFLYLIVSVSNPGIGNEVANSATS